LNRGIAESRRQPAVANLHVGTLATESGHFRRW